MNKTNVFFVCDLSGSMTGGLEATQRAAVRDLITVFANAEEAAPGG